MMGKHKNKPSNTNPMFEDDYNDDQYEKIIMTSEPMKTPNGCLYFIVLFVLVIVALILFLVFIAEPKQIIAIYENYYHSMPCKG